VRAELVRAELAWTELAQDGACTGLLSHCPGRLLGRLLGRSLVAAGTVVSGGLPKWADWFS
jgi:hypothetical protein